MESDPHMGAMLRSINSWGTFSDTAEGREKADRAFNKLKNYSGCFNSHTRQLYDQTLRSSGLAIPFAAIYAYVIGEIVEPGLYYSSGSQQQVEFNANATRIAFPEYGDFVMRKHSRSEAIVILALSGNLVELFA